MRTKIISLASHVKQNFVQKQRDAHYIVVATIKLAGLKNARFREWASWSFTLRVCSWARGLSVEFIRTLTVTEDCKNVSALRSEFNKYKGICVRINVAMPKAIPGCVRLRWKKKKDRTRSVNCIKRDGGWYQTRIVYCALTCWAGDWSKCTGRPTICQKVGISTVRTDIGTYERCAIVKMRRLSPYFCF